MRQVNEIREKNSYRSMMREIEIVGKRKVGGEK